MYIIPDIKELAILTIILLILLLSAMGFAHSLEKKAKASEQFSQGFDTDGDAQLLPWCRA